eukprot:gene4736-38101_t
MPRVAAAAALSVFIVAATAGHDPINGEDASPATRN